MSLLPPLPIVVALAAAAAGEVTLDLDLARRSVRGAASAPVLMVEFSDFKCHACEKFSLTVFPNLDKEFIQSQKLKLVFVDFPLVDEAHYTTVAESVHCAGDQGKYWPMHDLLWEKIGALGDSQLEQYAAGLGLDAAAFRGCLGEDRHRSRVLEDLSYAYRLGLSSRPTFFVGRMEPGQAPPGRRYRGRLVEGAQSYTLYRSLILRLLAQKDPP